jgi:multiple sugar transport system substrate-binding protein
MRRIVLSACSIAVLAAALPAQAQTLRVFVGGVGNTEPLREILDQYEADNPGITVELEVGGATSEVQQQYLSTVLASEDPALDILRIDVVRPAQYAAAGWAEPLDPYLGDEKDALLARYLPAYAEANQVDGALVALPAFADASLLYYRTDLLEKYDLDVPTTWTELEEAARIILDGEGDPNLQGLSIQGAAIEGAVCTFLTPYWSLGGTLIDDQGALALDRDLATQSFELWLGLIERGIIKDTISETTTDDTPREFQAGDVVFASLWSYGWAQFQGEESEVRGNVGVAPLPAVEGGDPAACIGGWQWAVSAFSDNKPEAVALVQYLAGPAGARSGAIGSSNLPALLETYDDPEVIAANPWFENAPAFLEIARLRPVSPRYTEISDVIRINTNAVLAGTISPDAAIDEIEQSLARILR